MDNIFHLTFSKWIKMEWWGWNSHRWQIFWKKMKQRQDHSTSKICQFRQGKFSPLLDMGHLIRKVVETSTFKLNLEELNPLWKIFLSKDIEDFKLKLAFFGRRNPDVRQKSFLSTTLNFAKTLGTRFFYGRRFVIVHKPEWWKTKS